MTYAIKSDKVRSEVIHNAELMRWLTISDIAVQMVKRVQATGTQGMTARQYSDKYEPTVVSCSQRLKHLYRRGYLKREEMVDPTGGTFFTYYVGDWAAEAETSAALDGLATAMMDSITDVFVVPKRYQQEESTDE